MNKPKTFAEDVATLNTFTISKLRLILTLAILLIGGWGMSAYSGTSQGKSANVAPPLNGAPASMAAAIFRPKHCRGDGCDHLDVEFHLNSSRAIKSIDLTNSHENKTVGVAVYLCDFLGECSYKFKEEVPRGKTKTIQTNAETFIGYKKIVAIVRK
jgi:hypothetical protein